MSAQALFDTIALLPVHSLIRRVEDRYQRETGRAFSSPLFIAYTELCLVIKSCVTAQRPYPLLLSSYLHTATAGLRSGSGKLNLLESLQALPLPLIGGGKAPPPPSLMVDSITHNSIAVAWTSNRPHPTHLSSAEALQVLDEWWFRVEMDDGGATPVAPAAAASTSTSSSTSSSNSAPGKEKENKSKDNAEVTRTGEFRTVYVGPGLQWSTALASPRLQINGSLLYRFRVRSERKPSSSGADSKSIAAATASVASEWSDVLHTRAYPQFEWNYHNITHLVRISSLIFSDLSHGPMFFCPVC
jgi:hypothetical protein